MFLRPRTRPLVHPMVPWRFQCLTCRLPPCLSHDAPQRPLVHSSPHKWMSSRGQPTTSSVVPAAVDTLVDTFGIRSSTCRITVTNVFRQPSYVVSATLHPPVAPRIRFQWPSHPRARHPGFLFAPLSSHAVYSMHLHPSLQPTYSSSHLNPTL